MAWRQLGINQLPSVGGRGGDGCSGSRLCRTPAALRRAGGEAFLAAPMLQTTGAALANVSLKKLLLLLGAVAMLKYLTIRSRSPCVGALGKARAGRQRKGQIWAALAWGWCWGAEEESGHPPSSLRGSLHSAGMGWPAANLVFGSLEIPAKLFS